MRFKDKHSWPALTVLLGILIFAVYFSWLSIVKADVFDTYSSDLSNMWQSAWNFSHGHGFVFTWSDFAKNFQRLSIHADYFLLLISPMTLLWPDPHSFLILQAVTVAIGGWFVYRIAAGWLKNNWLAAALAWVYLLYGPLQYAVVWQFHTETLAVTFILAAVEGLVAKRRSWVMWMWSGLALITKEHTGLLIGPLFFILGRREGRRRLGRVALFLAVGYSLVQFFIVIPAFRPPHDPHFLLQAYYPTLTAGSKHVEGPLSSIVELGTRLARPQVIQTVLYLLLPMGGLAIFSPLSIIGAAALVPQWLSDDQSRLTVFFHNHVLAIPFLMLSTIWGVKKTLPWVTRRRWATIPVMTGWLLSWALIGSIMISPNEWSRQLIPGFTSYIQFNPYLKNIPTLKKFIPPASSVSYSKQAGANFRDRLSAHPLPNGVTFVDYVVLVDGPKTLAGRQQQKDYEFFKMYLAHSAAFTPVYADGHNFVYRRDFKIKLETIPDEFISPVQPNRQLRT